MTAYFGLMSLPLKEKEIVQNLQRRQYRKQIELALRSASARYTSSKPQERRSALPLKEITRDRDRGSSLTKCSGIAAMIAVKGGILDKRCFFDNLLRRELRLIFCFGVEGCWEASCSWTRTPAISAQHLMNRSFSGSRFESFGFFCLS
jgi:hypothetical protein